MHRTGWPAPMLGAMQNAIIDNAPAVLCGDEAAFML
jgi:hypothetical protein